MASRRSLLTLAIWVMKSDWSFVSLALTSAMVFVKVQLPRCTIEGWDGGESPGHGSMENKAKKQNVLSAEEPASVSARHGLVSPSSLSVAG